MRSSVALAPGRERSSSRRIASCSAGGVQAAVRARASAARPLLAELLAVGLQVSVTPSE